MALKAKFTFLTLLWGICILPFHSLAAPNVPLRIAVASNFTPVLKQLLVEFTQQTQIQTQIISAASGTLYQQIKHGAPYDIFLSADSIRPSKLVHEGLAHAKSQTTYVYGQLALWSAYQPINSLTPLRELKNNSQRLAIANPNYAPYGIAAKEVLTALHLWRELNGQLIQGININQTFVQVRSKNIPLGLVALSQLKLNNLSGFIIPQHLYNPLAQDLVILSHSKQYENAEKLKTYLTSETVKKQLALWGYKNAIYSLDWQTAI